MKKNRNTEKALEGIHWQKKRPRVEKNIPGEYYARIRQIPWHEVLEKLGISRPMDRNGGIYFHCIFHDEKMASLHLWNNGKFHCFGCGKTGDVFCFVYAVIRRRNRFIPIHWYRGKRTWHQLPFVGPAQAAKFFKRHFGIPIPTKQKKTAS